MNWFADALLLPEPLVGRWWWCSTWEVPRTTSGRSWLGQAMDFPPPGATLVGWGGRGASVGKPGLQQNSSKSSWGLLGLQLFFSRFMLFFFVSWLWWCVCFTAKLILCGLFVLLWWNDWLADWFRECLIYLQLCLFVSLLFVFVCCSLFISSFLYFFSSFLGSFLPPFSLFVFLFSVCMILVFACLLDCLLFVAWCVSSLWMCVVLDSLEECGWWTKRINTWCE